MDTDIQGKSICILGIINMIRSIPAGRWLFTSWLLATLSPAVLAHYPILDCHYLGNKTDNEQVVCEASFSDRSKAPNIIMEVFSEDDEILTSGRTDDTSVFTFERPQGVFFIIMDAGPGHVLEISDEEVNGS